MSWRAKTELMQFFKIRAGFVVVVSFVSLFLFSKVLIVSCITRMYLPKDLGDSDFTGNVPCIKNYFRKIQNTLPQKTVLLEVSTIE